MKGIRTQPGQLPALGVTALLGAVLFYSGFFTFLFAVPVQVAWSRHGAQRGLAAAGATAVLILIAHTFQAVRLTGSVPGIILVDVLMPVGLLAGLAFFNSARQYPWWLRLLGGGGIALVAALPSLRFLLLLGQENGDVSEQFGALLSMIGVEHGQAAWISLVRRIVLSTVGLAMIAGIAANWWLGTGIVRRAHGGVVSLRGARVPEQLVWMVISGLAVIVVTWLMAVESFAPVGWNLFLVGSFLFGLQGVGLVQHLLHRRGMGAFAERWVLTIILAGLFIPGVNVIVTGGMPLLGISEIWIDYKRGERYEGDTEQ